MERILPWEHDLTHMPKYLICEACNMSKTQHRAHRRQHNTNETDPLRYRQEFGGCVTADWIILGGSPAHSGNGDTVALVVQDRFSQWIDASPKAVNSTDHAIQAFNHFAGQAKPELLYTDYAK